MFKLLFHGPKWLSKFQMCTLVLDLLTSCPMKWREETISFRKVDVAISQKKNPSTHRKPG